MFSSEEDSLKNSKRRLPHWNYPDSTYFVTWRLHGSQNKLDGDERTLIVDALRHFDLKRYQLFCFVIMDDHVLFRLYDTEKLSGLLHTWKSLTANRLQRQSGRQGPVWQDESYDRIVRNEKEFYDEARYVLNNPYKRWKVEEYTWLFWRHPDEHGQIEYPKLPVGQS